MMPRIQFNHVCSSSAYIHAFAPLLLETGQAQLAACVVDSLHVSRTVSPLG